MFPLAVDLFRATPLRPLAEAADLSLWDLGARGGVDVSLQPLAWCTKAIAFEPDPAAAGQLRAQGPAPWADVRVIEAAVAGRDGSRQLNVTEDPAGSTLLTPRPEIAARYGIAPLCRTAKQIDVETVSPPTACARYAVLPPAFLKLDIEGAELELLQGAGEMLDPVAVLKTEAAFVTVRDEQPNAWDIVEWLRPRGFVLMDIIEPAYWRRGNVACAPYAAQRGGWSRGRLAQADLIFLRDRDTLADDGEPTSVPMRCALSAAALGYLDHARDILERPNAGAAFKGLTGADPEPVLAEIAKRAGRRDVSRTIRTRLRDLIPLLRSQFGGVPQPRS